MHECMTKLARTHAQGARTVLAVDVIDLVPKVRVVRRLAVDGVLRLRRRLGRSSPMPVPAGIETSRRESFQNTTQTKNGTGIDFMWYCVLVVVVALAPALRLTLVE